jgi:YgiT-type zinc finger domain-containing protein
MDKQLYSAANKMKCMYCKGEMVYGSAPFHIDRNAYHVLWDSVPAWVCFQCGEAYFEGDEVEAIQAALVELDKRSAELTPHVA